MKLRVRVRPRERQVVPVQTEFIKLESFLKYCGVADTGGMAKNWIVNGEVSVNGEICTQRGKKLHAGDVVSFQQGRWEVGHADQ